MRIAKPVLCLLAFTLFAPTLVPGVQADRRDKKTVVTFGQSEELLGIILPAGTYTFKLSGSPSGRNIVQVLNADGARLLVTILAINNWRLKPTGETVVKFRETPGDAPAALRAWFSPGDKFGREFVYPKRRAVQLAETSAVIVPALDTDKINYDKLASIPLIAVTPDQKEVAVAALIQTTPPGDAVLTPAMAKLAPLVVTPVSQTEKLPQTGSSIPLIELFGGALCISIAFGLKLLLKQAS
jgi:hypothetical protein